MLYATPDQIERERDGTLEMAQSRMGRDPRRFELAKALLDDGRDKLRKLAVADLLAKAAPSELVTRTPSRRRYDRDVSRSCQVRPPPPRPAWPPAVALLERINLLREHVAKLAELDRLAKRSYALRFAIDPTPPQGHVHR